MLPRVSWNERALDCVRLDVHLFMHVYSLFEQTG